jgi:CxxC motif-containing protein (DUF1111 family)
MKVEILPAFAVLGLVSVAHATDLNLDIQAGGSNTISVGPGQVVSYTVSGVLSDGASQGLAMFSFDLEFSGGALPPAQTPTTDPIARFVTPMGFSNPSGFGGTPLDGVLRQVGGAQNTIQNTLATIPIGAVLTNVAQPNAPVVLARGVLSAPNVPGNYTLSASGLFANVIRQGETGTPFWRVDPCGAGSQHSLTLHVAALKPQHVMAAAPAHDLLASVRSERPSEGSLAALTAAEVTAAESRSCAPTRGSIAIQPRMGEPLAGLAPAQLDRFMQGKAVFNQTFTPADGLGPIFNAENCAHCHITPLGGASSKQVTRFGVAATATTPFDPLASLGGSLLQAESIDSATCAEVVPAQANVIAHRITPPLMGFGLVEAILDGDILVNAVNPPPGVHGVASLVHPLEDPLGTPRVARFGWKDQIATLLSFSADASLNEMGITNRFLPSENAPNGDAALLAQCDSVADPEDQADAQGFFKIDRQTDFMKFLAPPPQTPRSGMTGEALFIGIGCSACHLATPFLSSPTAEPGLDDKPVKAYTDFLLHDMGSLGDGIVQGAASEHMMRTAPLWGVYLRGKVALLHDGRSAGGSFAHNVASAIANHDGEGSTARSAFFALTSSQQNQVTQFLNSLGRAEFDWDGNLAVDDLDWFALEPLVTGPGSFFTPDDAAAVADIDQSGSLDLIDFGWMQRAFTGS